VLFRSVCVFRGERQLRLGKNGVLNVLPSSAESAKQQLATAAVR
jgi:hypothetical protein